MKNKFFKSITFVVAIAMLMSMVPAVVSADAAISDVNVVVENDVVTVTATVSGLDEFTLLAVRDSFAYDGVEDIPADEADLELQVEYIDQPAISGSNLTFSFPLRDREGDLAMAVTDRYINVFIGGAGADAQVGSYSKKYDAPVLAVEDLKEKYYSEDEEVVVTIEFADDTLKALWESKDLVAKIGDEELSDVNWDALTDGYITIPASSFANASYTNAVITIAEAADAEFEVAKTDEVSFAIASRVEEAKAAIVALKAEYNENGTDATIAVPAIDPVAGVEISYEIITEGYEVEDGVINVVRADGEDAQDKVIEYKVVLTYDEEVVYEETKSVSVKPVGVDRYTIVADDVTLSTTAFGIANAKVATVKIGKDDIDPTAQTVAINGDTMFYVPERSTGDVYTFVAIARTNNASTADVAAVAEIVDEAATAIYYGKVSNPVNNSKLVAADVARALAMFKANNYSDAYTDQQYLSADVIGNGQVKAAQVARLLAAFKSPGSTDKSGFNILAN